jgi:hypothetical protein
MFIKIVVYELLEIIFINQFKWSPYKVWQSQYHVWQSHTKSVLSMTKSCYLLLLCIKVIQSHAKLHYKCVKVSNNYIRVCLKCYLLK